MMLVVFKGSRPGELIKYPFESKGNLILNSTS